MKLPCLLQFRILKEAVKALVTGPYTSKFPYEPHIPKEGFRGKPEFSKKDCMGCTACYQVCPPRAIECTDEVKNGAWIRSLSINLDVCIMCGQCQANCPTEKGIRLVPEFNLATVKVRIDKQRIEKELLLCEACNTIVAPFEQLLWVAKKLGTLSFSNASLILAYLGNIKLSLGERPAPKENNEFIRSDRFKILCPRCRREAVLKS